ncbi:hypothetical protein NX059_004434 [Plenodomus lindquistii]|nr:hypothetical protein NX059_004434 [Plenodomus lindquistii]
MNPPIDTRPSTNENASKRKSSVDDEVGGVPKKQRMDQSSPQRTDSSSSPTRPKTTIIRLSQHPLRLNIQKILGSPTGHKPLPNDTATAADPPLDAVYVPKRVDHPKEPPRIKNKDGPVTKKGDGTEYRRCGGPIDWTSCETTMKTAIINL